MSGGLWKRNVTRAHDKNTCEAQKEKKCVEAGGKKIDEDN